MKLTLDRDDLKEEFKDIACSRTRFEHFTSDAQDAILVVGRATFYEWDRRSYNAIHPNNFES